MALLQPEIASESCMSCESNFDLESHFLDLFLQNLLSQHVVESLTILRSTHSMAFTHSQLLILFNNSILAAYRRSCTVISIR